MSEHSPSNSEVSQAPEPSSYVVEGNTYRKLIAERDAYRSVANDLARQLRKRTPADTSAPPERAAHEPPAVPVAYRKFIDSAYERHPRYTFREDSGIGAPEGWEPLYTQPTPPPSDALRWEFFRKHHMSDYRGQRVHEWLIDNLIRADGIDGAIDELMRFVETRRCTCGERGLMADTVELRDSLGSLHYPDKPCTAPTKSCRCPAGPGNVCTLTEEQCRARTSGETGDGR